MEIVWIRHGKTEGNVRRAYIGKTDEPLCEEGEKEIVDFLYKGLYPKVEAVYATELIRTQQTAHLIYPNQPIQIIKAFNECNFGDFEGKNYKELQHHPIYREWIENKGRSAFPNGESGDDFKRRCQKGFEALVSQLTYEKIACICHGGTIMAVLEGFAIPPKAYYEWQVENGLGFKTTYNPSTHQLENIRPLAAIRRVFFH